MTIVQGTCGTLYSVREAGYVQAWLGVKVKKVKGGYEPKAGAKEQLVRKAGAVVVAQA